MVVVHCSEILRDRDIFGFDGIYRKRNGKFNFCFGLESVAENGCECFRYVEQSRYTWNDYIRRGCFGGFLLFFTQEKLDFSGN